MRDLNLPDCLEIYLDFSEIFDSVSWYSYQPVWETD